MTISGSVNSPQTLSINSPGAEKMLDIVSYSKELAKRHRILYHCTKADSLLNIIKSGEFWLSNLRKVNDKEEPQRIDAPEFEESYFVASFTELADISCEHWHEYGYPEGVLFSVRPEWFQREATFISKNGKITNDDNYIIYRNNDHAVAAIKKAVLQNPQINPLLFYDFGFVQMIYDDQLKVQIQNSGTMHPLSSTGNIYIPQIGGIVKNKSGICSRDNQQSYTKDWESEKEVRLRAIIQRYIPGCKLASRDYLTAIAVKLSNSAFDEFSLRFSPDFTDDRKNHYISEILKLLPNSKLNVL